MNVNARLFDSVMRFFRSLPDDVRNAIIEQLAKDKTEQTPPKFRCKHCSDENRLKAIEQCRYVPKRLLDIVTERLCCVLTAPSQGSYCQCQYLSRTTQYRWMQRYLAYGLTGLIPKKSTGRPRKS